MLKRIVLAGFVCTLGIPPTPSVHNLNPTSARTLDEVVNPVAQNLLRNDGASLDPSEWASIRLAWMRFCLFIIKILTVLPFEVDGQMI
jgi:hypothetical protein